MKKKSPRIIYFIKGAVPSADQIEEAEAIGDNVVFRNATLIPSTGALEYCFAVAGEVPARYEKAFETVTAPETSKKETEADAKDKLEAYAKEKYGIDLDRRKSLANLEAIVKELDEKA